MGYESILEQGDDYLYSLLEGFLLSNSDGNDEEEGKYHNGNLNTIIKLLLDEFKKYAKYNNKNNNDKKSVIINNKNPTASNVNGKIDDLLMDDSKNTPLVVEEKN